MNATDPDRRHLHDLEDQLARMTVRAEKAEAERDAALQDGGRQNARAYKAEIALADLEAELAAHRAEAGRPIGRGDVIQGNDSFYLLKNQSQVGVVLGVQTNEMILEVQKLGPFAYVEVGSQHYRCPLGKLTRIGRAVRMPDGSPVPEIGGGA